MGKRFLVQSLHLFIAAPKSGHFSREHQLPGAELSRQFRAVLPLPNLLIQSQKNDIYENLKGFTPSRLDLLRYFH